MRRSRGRSRKRKSGLGSAIGWLFLLLLVAATAGLFWLVALPFGPTTETFVEIEPHQSTPAIAGQLEESGIIRSRYAFDLLRLIKHGTLRAGEYRFDRPLPLIEVYTKLLRGEVYTRTVIVPEGASLFEIGARLEQAGFGPRQQFLLEQAQQTALIADLDPGARSLEGYLFPDTYHFPRRMTTTQICAAMVHRFRAEAAQMGLTNDLHRVVTLASLVERETAIDSERPLVASVFTNRLAHQMPLMTDPSVIYGLELENRWRGAIYQSDLKLDTPYNTYLHAGLPPGPIANPGRRSLMAALEPAATEYLYFVAAGANPQGHSLFARTLDEHTHNVADYREAMRRAGKR